MNMLLKRMIFVEMTWVMKRRILLGLIFIFVFSIAFIPGIDRPAFAVTYTEVSVGGTASASSEVSSSYAASKAFDSNTSTYWSSQATQYLAPPTPSLPTQWLRYQLPSPNVVTKYKITGVFASWNLQGSNNGSSWTTLHSGTQAQLGQEITFSNTTSYLYYRILGYGYSECVPHPMYPGYYVCAYYAAANELDLYSPNPPTTPGTPSGPSTDADGSYTISWGAVSYATSYQLQENYNGGGWSTVYNSSGTAASRSGRSPGTWYYRVNACNVGGCSAYSGTRTVLVAPPVPGTPSGPTGTEYDGAYTISWNAVSGASSYQLQESLNSGTWSTIYNSSGTSVSRTGRSAGTWSYRVLACGATCSAYSGTKNVAVAVPAPPATPAGPGTDPDGYYTISWNAVTGATSYQLRENLNSGSWSTVYNSSGISTTRSGRSPGTWNYQVLACSAVGCSGYSGTRTVLVPPAPPATPSGPSTNYDGAYTISWNAVSGASSYQLQESLNSGSWSTIYNSSGTSVSRSGRSAGTWSYRVLACGATCSAYSGIKSVTVAVPVPPATPSGPSTDPDGSYDISWNAVTGATSYQLQENLNGGSWNTVYNSSGISTTRSGRSPGTWNYQVLACSAVGCSGYSGTRTVLVAPTIPDTPSGPTTSYSGEYTISWNSVTGASSYTLQEKLNSGSWNTIYNSSGTSVSRSGRSAGTWYYQVKACGATCSAYSGAKSVTVAVPVPPAAPSGPGTDPDGSYDISWNAVTGSTSYQLQENLNGGGWSMIYNSSGTSTTRSGRSPGTWNYRLQACSAVGCSAYSSPDTTVLVAPLVPDTPSGPTTSYSGAYTISWNSVTGASSYTLQEKFNSGTWSDVYTDSSTSVSLTGRTTAGTWYYQVKACGATCSAYSNAKSVVVSVPVTPGTPTGPDTDTDGSYTISWNGATGAASYQLEENYNGGAWSTVYSSTGLSTTLSGRSPGAWNYRLKATNPVGTSGYSGTTTVLVLPEAPVLSGSGVAIDGNNANYTVSWNNVTGASNYLLQEKRNIGEWTDIYDGAGTYKELSKQLSLDWGTWSYQVKACKDCGAAGVVCSNYSNTITTDVPKPPPPEFTIYPSIDYNGNYTLRWSIVNDATGYQIQEKFNDGSWVDLNLDPVDSTSIDITGRTNQGTYYYRVLATPFDGYSAEISIVVTVPVVPEAPDGPATDADGSYTISWTAIDDASSYTLQENFNGGAWSDIYSGPNLSTNISGRGPGAWKYRLQACSAVGCSAAYSEETTVLVAPPIPDTPSGPTTSYSGEYTISWNSVTGASSYTLQEKFNSGTWSDVYTDSSTSVSLTGRTTAGTWYYQVKACGATCSAYSGAKSVVVSVPVNPGTPTGPATDADGSYTISWNEVTGATSYQLEENYNGGAWSTVYNSTGLSTTLSERSPGVWNYRLQACSAVGCSAYSSPDTTVLVAPPVPGTPSGPTDTQYDGEYTISWNTVSGATSYQLQERLDGGSWSTVYNGPGTSISRSDQDAGTWGYRVSACGATCSEFSSEKNVVVFYFPPTATFSAAPTEISPNDDTTLSWSTTNATSIVIEPIGYSSTEQTGSWDVKPADIVNEYSLTAYGRGGSSDPIMVIVIFKPVYLNYFTASANLVLPESQVTLSWSVENAVSVTITGPGGTLYSVNGIDIEQTGSILVNPATDATYTITVGGNDGPISKNIDINVESDLPDKGVTYEYDELGRIKSITRIK